MTKRLARLLENLHLRNNPEIDCFIKEKLKDKLIIAATSVYIAGDIGTFIYITFLDGYPYNWWNW